MVLLVYLKISGSLVLLSLAASLHRVEVSSEVMLAAGLDGNIYQQDVNAMSIYTDWELLLEGLISRRS